MHVVIEGLCTWEMHLLLLLCLPSSGGGGAVRGDSLPVGGRLKGLVQPVWAAGFWSQCQRHPCSCRHPWQLLTRLEVQPLGTQGMFSSTFLVSPLRLSVYLQVAAIFLGMSDQLVTFCVFMCVCAVICFEFVVFKASNGCLFSLYKCLLSHFQGFIWTNLIKLALMEAFMHIWFV